MKAILIGILMLMMSFLQAQVQIIINDKKVSTNEIENKITEYTDRLTDIVEEHKKKMKAEIDSVNVLKENGEISKEEAEELKDEIAEKYAEKIEEDVEDLVDELEEMVDRQVEISLYGIEEDDEKIVVSKDPLEVEIKLGKHEKKYKRLKRFNSSFTLGFSNLSDGWDLNTMNNSGLNFGKSIDFSVTSMYQIQPTVTSPFTFVTGLGFRSNNLRVEGLNYFTETTNGFATIEPTPYDRQRKAKMRNNSLFIPVGFKYTFKKKKFNEKTKQEYRNVRKGFYVGVMGYGGINLSNKSIVKYYNEDGNRRKDKSNMQSANEVYYGLEFNLGFRGINLYMKKDLNDYFSKTTLPVNNGVEFGFRFGF